MSNLQEINRNYDIDSQITEFQQLIDSLQGPQMEHKEMIEKKNALLSLPEWTNPSKSNLTKLKDQSNTLMIAMMTKIQTMSRGLKTLIQVNNQLQETISVRRNTIIK